MDYGEKGKQTFFHERGSGNAVTRESDGKKVVTQVMEVVKEMINWRLYYETCGI